MTPLNGNSEIAPVKDLIRLSRPLNLFIIALTMWCMRWFVIRPAVHVNDYHLQLSSWLFWLLVLSVVMITAAGNIINDYFDQRTDRINRPGSIIVGVTVKRRVAMIVHQILNVGGILIGLFVAWKIGFWRFAIIHLIASGMLWFYSTNFKRQLIIGNLVVAFLTGLVPLIVGVFEIPLLFKNYGADVKQYFQIYLPGEDFHSYFFTIFYFIIGYSVFAFILNLIREILKDMADVEGDKQIGSQTIPIVLGIKATRWIVVTLMIGGLFLLYYVQQRFFGDIGSFSYLTITVAIPVLLSAYFAVSGKERKAFSRSAGIMKIAMLGGLLYSVVNYLIYYPH